MRCLGIEGSVASRGMLIIFWQKKTIPLFFVVCAWMFKGHTCCLGDAFSPPILCISFFQFSIPSRWLLCNSESSGNPVVLRFLFFRLSYFWFCRFLWKCGGESTKMQSRRKFTILAHFYFFHFARTWCFPRRCKKFLSPLLRVRVCVWIENQIQQMREKVGDALCPHNKTLLSPVELMDIQLLHHPWPPLTDKWTTNQMTCKISIVDARRLWILCCAYVFEDLCKGGEQK